MVIKKQMGITVSTKVVKRSASLLLLVFLLSSCSHTIKVRTPSSRYISPEAGGKLFASEVSGYYATSTRAQVNLKDEKTDDPLVLDNKNELFESIGLNANIGLHEKFDFITSSGGSYTPILYGIKYQLIGKIRKESKKGDTSLAITVMSGKTTQTQESGEDLELTPVDDDTTVELKSDVMDYSIIYGQRLTDTGLAYTGVSYSKHNVSGLLESQNSLLDKKTISYKAEVLGAHLGYISYVNKILSLKAELSTQQVNWSYTKTKHYTYFSAGMAFYWD